MYEQNEIVFGNCFEVLKEVPDKTFNLVFTDVPYKQEFHGRGLAKQRPNYLKIKDYGANQDWDYKEFFELCLKKLKQVNFFTFCNKETKFEFIKLAKEHKFGYQELCFCKSHPTPFTNNQWLSDVEYGIHIYSKIPVLGNYHTKRSWFVMNNFKQKGQKHPTAKNVDVCCKILENISKEGDYILDPFSGSGTTAECCLRMNRRSYNIEKDETFYKDSVARLNDVGRVENE